MDSSKEIELSAVEIKKLFKDFESYSKYVDDNDFSQYCVDIKIQAVSKKIDAQTFKNRLSKIGAKNKC